MRTMATENKTDLIQVVQLPIIAEQLQTLRARWEQRAADAEAMVCTEETIQAVKAFRAEMRKEFDDVEVLRKAVKKAVMGPYERFEDTYGDCISKPFAAADRALKSKIDDTETALKKICEDGLRDYFAELCAAHHVEWLQYEQAGVKVDMASAKQKTPKKLRERLAAFVEHVSTVTDSISCVDKAEEVMTEYKLSLDFAKAVDTVLARHKRIEAERQQMEQRAAQKAVEDEAVRRAEALAPPTVVEEQISVTFTVTDTKARLIALREWMKANGYKYE